MRKRNSELSHPYGSYGSGFFEWLHIFFVAVVIVGLVHTCVFQLIRVDGISMMPTMSDDTYVVVSRLSYLFGEPEFGDIIVFYNENDEYNYVKRVIGIPGDEIIIKDGDVYRNGNLLKEPYIADYTDGEYRENVSVGTYFCMGDNRNLSIDSRNDGVGCIEEKQIIGKVVCSVFPYKNYNRGIIYE